MTLPPRQLSFRELIRADLKAGEIGRKSPLFFVAAFLGLNKFSFVLWFRMAAAVHDKGRFGRVLAAALTRLNGLCNSSEPSPAAKIGPGLHVPHTMGVGWGAITVGCNLTIMHHASMGMRDRTLDQDNRANFPTLGDNVQIGPGAMILGPVFIGDGATIAPNSVVLQDMEAGAIAIGNPARIMKRQADVSPTTP